MIISFILNGEKVSITEQPYKKLLYILRENFGLTGIKEGCGKGECGSCLVYLNGELVNSCLIPAFRIENKEVITIEGLSKDKVFSDIKKVFSEKKAFKCDFCKTGILMASFALLSRTNNPTKEEIKEALSGNICNCTGYRVLFESIKKASSLIIKGESDKRTKSRTKKR